MNLLGVNKVQSCHFDATAPSCHILKDAIFAHISESVGKKKEKH